MEFSCIMSIRFSLQVRSFFCFIFLVSRYFTCMLLPCRNNSLFRAEFLLYFAVAYFFELPLNTSAFWKPRHESTCLFLTFQVYNPCWMKLYYDHSLSNILHNSKQQDSFPDTKTTNSINQFRPSLDTITLGRHRFATESSPQVSLKRQFRYFVT